ncbi:stage II sporulation protein P [Paenibacillus flagellatus]|uniref:Stage II sporulation protein P n=1 Tax=Paenibacillus flagellatus TaxID=2211139 RepID=A0A2V5K2R7_9BACL|nr:stage II sporulation protein P [Paenibacillus flagellatus]PYI51853.1 stage II sporulation protein P [Paenibacillus flagellatus]
MSIWSKWAATFKSASLQAGQGGVIRRIFAVYVGVSLLLFALAAAAALWQSYASVTPKSAMKRMTASVSPQFFVDMLGLESAAMKREGESTFSHGKVGGYLAQMLLHVNPGEPKSLLASELPGLRGGREPGGQASPGVSSDAGKPGGDGEAPPSREAAGASSDGADAGTTGAGGQPPAQGQAASGPDGAAAPDPVPVGKLTTGGRKVVFVYHSHPRESWVPELNVQSVNEAEDAQKNVTLIGKRLADKLEEQGIGSVHSGKDYPTAVKGYNWNFSYKYSLETVKEAFAENKDITFLFDIHRDSAGRDVTTAKIGGSDYAKVYFIVGKKNAKWEQNEAFAKRIHEKLESEYPGLSRGIWDKGSGGHAEYNQSVSPNSMLIEVGGAYNTLEECYRTADVLAKTIAGLYWDAEKVNAQTTASNGGQAAVPTAKVASAR